MINTKWLTYMCIFFFFKQKTAYEMRISGWSSDVCSSDLVGITGQRDWDVAVVDGSRIVLTPTASGQSAAVDNAMQQAVEVIRSRIDEMGTREQIGRASCRERVCQYV